LDDTADILREIAAAIRSPDLVRAVGMAEAALAEGREHPLLLNLRAYRLEQQGLYAEALGDLERARGLAPGDVPTLNALGLCLANLDRLADAVEAFDAAIAADPNFAPAHFNRGWTSEQLGELDRARRAFERAHALNPRDPASTASLASLAARRGDWSAARELAGQALSLAPGEPKAAMALASTDLAAGAFREAEAMVTELISSERLGPLDRALAHGLLGDILDAADRPPEAFAEWSTANRILRAHYAPRYARPGLQTAAELLAALLGYFERADPAAWRAPPAVGASPAAGHVFLVGFPRSGTTLLERVLSSRPEVLAIEERETLADPVREFMAGPAGLDRLSRIGGADLAAQRDAYWRNLGASVGDPAGKLVIDKLPLNTVKLPLIAKLFPDAKVLFAVRDPRDVVFSCLRHRFRMNASMYEFLGLEGAARFYGDVMRFAALCRGMLEIPVHAHRYEDLVTDFDAQTQAICEFIGLRWSAEMKRFADAPGDRSIATPSSAQVARGLYSEGIGQWRRHRDALAPVMSYLQPWVERLGYQTEAAAGRQDRRGPRMMS
jgi:Flp pilus assembly protein TadD